MAEVTAALDAVPPRRLTVGAVREALADLPDWLDVDLLIDHALAGHGSADTCDAFEVDALAPVVDVRRGEASVEVVVDWERAG